MKKILALVLALTLALGTFTFVAAAPEDVVGTDCENAVARLGALEILAGYEDGTFRPNQPVTRAEFAKIIVGALGVGEAALYAAGDTIFWDIPEGHWATGFINVAVNMGIINGYPDGSFAPENQVTFAEAIKMIVAALGYTPRADALGGYPGGYLAIAAEKEITEDVSVVTGLSANRGDVAIMVDNALEVDLMEQKEFGDRPTWEEKPGKTLLNSRLNVIETKGFVTDISKISKLDENEFEITRYDRDGNSTSEIYEMAIDVNTESLFLKEVKVLYKKKGDDKKVVWVGIETAAKDIVFDTIDVFSNDEVTLKVADKDYAWVDDNISSATVYVNYKEYHRNDNKVEVGDYGYFIFDGKEIVAANLFKFDDNAKGFVTDVAKDEVEYRVLGEDAEEDVLELDDYDEIYVYNKDFTKADLDDVDEGSVIYYWDNDDDELFLIVVNDVVEGKVTRLRDDRVTIDGKNYKKDSSIVSLDEGKNFDGWDAEDVEDVMDERVALYLDINGNIAALVTDAEATSDTLYGIVTWFYEGRNPEVAIFTSDGEEVEYGFDKRSDANVFYKAPDELLDGLNDNDTPEVFAVKYKLNSDGEIADGEIELYNDQGEKIDAGVGENVEDVTALDAAKKKADKKYIDEMSGNDVAATYFIGSGTVLMKALDDDELDPELVDYDNLISMDYTGGIDKEVIVFGEKGKTAKFMVFLDPEFEGTKDDVYFGVVTDDPWKVGKDWFVEVDVFDGKKEEFKVDKDDVAKGDLVEFKLDSKDKMKLTDAVWAPADESGFTAAKNGAKVELVSGTVYERDGSYLVLGDGGPGDVTYYVAPGAVLYKLKEKGSNFKIDGTISRTKIGKDDKIVFLFHDGEREVVAGLVKPE